jgi:hypothetical protein
LIVELEEVDKEREEEEDDSEEVVEDMVDNAQRAHELDFSKTPPNQTKVGKQNGPTYI